MKAPAASILPFLFTGLIFLLLLIGLLFVFEASGPESYLTYENPFRLTINHGIGIGLSLIAFVIGILIPTRVFTSGRLMLYLLGLGLLLATFVPGIGLELNGASRWIHIGFMVFQPVEFMKFAIIVFCAGWMASNLRIQSLIITLLFPSIIIILQPDLGSLLVLSGIVISMFFVAGGDLKQLGKIALFALPIIVLLIVFEPYRLQRVITFLNPESDPLGASFHVRQLTLALGRGGIMGQGLGNSSQKFSYVPEASTDSIAAIIGEETGFIGLALLCSIYAVFASIALKMLEGVSVERRLLGLGILTWVALQVLLNLAAVSALVPLTGIPLPFISYGRSSLVMLLFALGVFLRIYLEQQKQHS